LVLVSSANDLLVLRQYGFLDHLPRFSIGRKCNISLTALAVRPIRNEIEKTGGTFDDPLMSWPRKQSSKQIEA
jgi:hypothetical protein